MTQSSRSRSYYVNNHMPAEKSWKRPHKKLPFILVLAVAVIVGFTLLPIRPQGRIVEIITFGDWPLEWAVRQQFERKQPELRSIIQFMDEAPEVVGLKVTPVGLRASLAENRGVDHALDKPNILQALVSIEADFVKGYEDRVVVFLGSEFRGSDSFEVSYVYPLMPIELANCETIVASQKNKIGRCGFRLDPNWHAVYQWYPEDAGEFEKAVDELK